MSRPHRSGGIRGRGPLIQSSRNLQYILARCAGIYYLSSKWRRYCRNSARDNKRTMATIAPLEEQVTSRLSGRKLATAAQCLSGNVRMLGLQVDEFAVLVGGRISFFAFWPGASRVLWRYIVDSPYSMSARVWPQLLTGGMVAILAVGLPRWRPAVCPALPQLRLPRDRVSRPVLGVTFDLPSTLHRCTRFDVANDDANPEVSRTASTATNE